MPRRVLALRKWGNSRAIVIPADIAVQMHLNVTDLLYVSVERGSLVFTPMQTPMSQQPLRESKSVTDGDSEG